MDALSEGIRSTVKNGINHKNGKEAVTHYKVLERFGNATYIECRLKPDVRIRSVCIWQAWASAARGYGLWFVKNPYHLQGQALHAMILGFRHPVTGEYMEFTAPLPEYFEKLLEKLRK